MKKYGILVIGVAFLVLCAFVGTVSALEYDAGKNTLEGAGGTVNDDLSYARGDTVYYRIYLTPTSENVTVTGAKDILPDGSEAPLPGPYPFALADDTTKTWEVEWDIPSDWPSDTITNRAEINLTDQFGTPNQATISIKSTIISEPTPTPPLPTPSFLFTFEHTCCRTMTFDGSASYAPDGIIVNHTWSFGDGTDSGVINGPPGVITHTYATCGVKMVTLSGYNDKGLTNSTTMPVDVPCGPTVKANADKTAVYSGAGTVVTFSCTGTVVEPGLTPTYKWTFDDMGTGSSDNVCVTSRVIDGEPDTEICATLTVNDSHCEETNMVCVLVVSASGKHEVPLSPYYPKSNKDWWLFQYNGTGYNEKYTTSDGVEHEATHNSNCGPASAAMVINYLRGKGLKTTFGSFDSEDIPDVKCTARGYYCQEYLRIQNKPEEIYSKGYYNSDWSDPGAWDFQIQNALSLENINSRVIYGTDYKNAEAYYQEIEDAIDDGSVCIACVNPTYYIKKKCVNGVYYSGTKVTSHWTVVYGYDDAHVYLNDPGWGRFSDEKKYPIIKKDFTEALWKVKSDRWREVIIISDKIIPGEDTITPKVDFFNVTPASVPLGDAFTIDYTVSDSGGSGLKQVELWRAIDTNGDGQPDWPSGQNVGIHYLSGNGPTSDSFSDAPDAADTYWYGIHVVDNAGNLGFEPEPPGPIKVKVGEQLISRIKMMEIAEAYKIHHWAPTGEGNKFHGTCPKCGKPVKTPDRDYYKGWKDWKGWEFGEDNIGVPYQWGGFSSLPGLGLIEEEDFDNQCKGIGTFVHYIGDIDDTCFDWGCECTHACGVDCSGFVARCWNLPWHPGYPNPKLSDFELSYPIKFENLNLNSV